MAYLPYMQVLKMPTRMAALLPASLCLLALLFPGRGVSAASAVTACAPNSTDIAQLLATNTSIILEKGNYCVSEYVLVANKEGFLLAGTAGGPNAAIIQCSEGAGLAFLNVTDLTMSNVTILNCGVTGSNLSDFVRQVNESVDMFYTVPDSSSAAVLIAASTDVTLLDVEIRESRGYGLIAINLYGEVNIIGAVFGDNWQQNPCRTYDLLEFTEHKGLYVGGGALIMFFDTKEGAPQPTLTQLMIADSVFVNNSACYTSDLNNLYFQISRSIQDTGYTIGGGGGLSLKACQSSFSVEIVVEGSSFSNNHASIGGGANVATFRHTNLSAITFRNCNFTGNVFDVESQRTFGGGLSVVTDLWYKDSDVENVSILVEGCHFQSNRVEFGGAVVAFAPFISGGSTTASRNHINFTDCMFLENHATYGSAVYISTLQGTVFPIYTGPFYTFDNCTFSDNNRGTLLEAAASSQGSGALHVANVAMILRKSFISGTTGSALWAEAANTRIEGKVTMTENSALYGGGIAIIGYGLIVMSDNSQLIIENNTAARVGGGVYYTSAGRIAASGSSYDCFLLFGSNDLFCPNCTFQKMNVSITITGNHATLGSVIYGSLLDSCLWAYNLTAPYGPGGVNKSHTIHILYEEYVHNFQFAPDLNKSIAVNTDPVRPHVNSSGMGYVEVMPGEYFHVQGSAQDRLGQSVSDFLVLWVLNNDFFHGVTTFAAQVGEHGLWLVGNKSETVARVFGPENSSTTVAFTSLQSAGMSLMTVSLTNCSNGFLYNASAAHCECDPKFKDFSDLVRCSETYANISIKNDVWFGNLDGSTQLGNDTDNYVADFCLSIDCNITHSQGRESEWVVVNTSDLDTQCPQGGNRGGLFCGRCREGFSVMLGTSRCTECRGNTGVTWIILFALLGIFLLAAIAFLNVNVSDGWINGVILYANIYTIFSGTLISRRVAFPTRFNVYFLFSWLSLQWGIETCLYEGMTPLAHNGLELVFPIYLVLLVLTTVLISRWSVKEKWRKLFGNPLKVIATLLLLTFSAFMGVCIRLLGFSVISTFSHQHHIRWLLDSNVEYFSSADRIVLVLLSIVLMLVLVTFVLFLLMPHHCGKYRLHCCSRAQRRARPFIDAFQGPFKSTLYISRTWEGWRFFFRIILHIIANFVSAQARLWWLLFALMLFHSAQSLLSPYRFWMKNVLDSFFTLNMSLLVVLLLASDNFDISNELFLSFYHLLLTSALLTSISVLLYSASPVLKAILVKSYARVCKKEVKVTFTNSYVDPDALQGSDQEGMTYGSVNLDPGRALVRESFIFQRSDSGDHEKLKNLST